MQQLYLNLQKIVRFNNNQYLNNIVEQDRRCNKKRIVQGLGFKEFESAKRTRAGIEIVHMIKKNQMISQGETIFDPCISLAAQKNGQLTILDFYLIDSTESQR